MNYHIELSRGAVRDLKKLDRPLRDFLYQQFHEISANPYHSPKLKGEFQDLRSYHCRYQGIDYRIIYYINEAGKLIIIALVGSRENLYKELRRRL